MLAEELLRAGIEFDSTTIKMIDIQNIFHKLEQRTLIAAYKFYCGRPLENAHSAAADITATWEILEAQIERYPELKNDVDFLSEFSSRGTNVDLAGRIVLNENKIPVFNFGKHNGKPVTEVFEKEPSYYSWMMNGDFPLTTKKVLTQLKTAHKK